jgi:hypothetical protein
MLVLFDCVLIAVDASQTLVRHAIYFVDLWRQSIMDGPNTSQQVRMAAPYACVHF